MNTYKIDNGFNLHLINTLKFKTTTAIFLIKNKLTHENSTKNALLCEYLKSCNEHYKERQDINIKQEELYGSVFESSIVKKGEYQLMQFYLEVTSESILNDTGIFEEGLCFLHDIIYKPYLTNGVFNEDKLQKSKIILKEKIKDRLNDKNEYAKQRCIELMCKEDPFGVNADGYEEDVEKITPKELYGHYKKTIEECCVDFILIGAISEEKAKSVVKKIFQTDIRIESEHGIVLPFQGGEGGKGYFEALPISQGKLCIGYSTGLKQTGESHYKQMLFNMLLGQSPDSKLFVNVREKNSLCYMIGSQYYRFKSIFLIYAGIEEKDYQRALDVINEQIEACRQRDITTMELNTAKNYLLRRYESITDYPATWAEFHLSGYLLGDNMKIKDIEAEVDKVTIDDMCDVANQLKQETIYFLSGGNVHEE